MESADRDAEQLLCRIVRHRETLRHSLATRDLAYALAIACGCDSTRARAIACAALLHDVGKGTLPESLLDAPRRLTHDETLLLRTHAQAGARIAAHAGIDSEICQWIGLHHERPDGSGYEGIRGDAIPTEARIVIVADVWEATGAQRPYSPYHTRSERWRILIETGCAREVAALHTLLEEDVLARVG